MTTHLRVRQPGLSTTMQDLGRPGFQHVGVPVSGALDALSLRLANALVGNDQGAAALEFCLLGPELEAVGGSVRVAVTGAVVPELAGHGPLPSWRTFLLQPGDVLRVGRLAGEACGYVAVEGGFDIAPVLGSRSTYTRAGIGGFQGRRLAPDDDLPLRLASAELRPEVGLARPPKDGPDPVRVILGPNLGRFSPETVSRFLSGEYRVSANADRIGLRLEGPALDHVGAFEIPSEATVNGSIQVPGDGQPIVLLADRQTTGGYAKIATVATADLPRLGRMAPGARLRFQAIEPAAGIALARRAAAELAGLVGRIAPVATATPRTATDLLALNLVDGFVNGLVAEDEPFR